jgi:hypothetical protein
LVGRKTAMPFEFVHGEVADLASKMRAAAHREESMFRNQFSR